MTNSLEPMTDTLEQGVVEQLRGAFLDVLDDQPFLRVGPETLDRLVHVALSTRPQTSPDEVTLPSEVQKLFSDAHRADDCGQPLECDPRAILMLQTELRHMETALSMQSSKPVSGDAEPERYDAGLLGDGGGGVIEWWRDYIRAELDRAHDFYADQFRALSTPTVSSDGLREVLEPFVQEIDRVEREYDFDGRPPHQLQPLMISLGDILRFRQALKQEAGR